MVRLSLLLGLVLLLPACGDDGLGGGAGQVPRDDAGDRAIDAGNGDVESGIEPVACPFDVALEFGRNGLVTASGVIDRRAGCLTGTRLQYTHWQAGSATSTIFGIHCWWEPAPCDASTALAAVREAMANPEVKAALAEEPPGIYGLDRRAEDDGVYIVRAGGDCRRPRNMGSGFDLGDACEEGTPGCHPIPPAIALFVDRLKELERQTQKEPRCPGM